MSAALDFTYRYAYPSAVDTTTGGSQLSLATCGSNQEQPYFFDGVMHRPRLTADMLLVLNDIVRTHFFLPRPPLLDPVLTSNEHALRIEGFSGCCGVYARVDLLADAFAGECMGRGTTNVDFNPPMRAALMRLRDSEQVRFAVGRNEVALERDGTATVEKKVKLPLRWIKSFSEVQSYQPKLIHRFDVSAPEGLKFLRSLPKASAPKQPSYVVPAGGGLRLSQRPRAGAIPVRGTHRIKILEPLLSRAEKFSVWSDDDHGISGWEVSLEVARFFLLVSPEIYRGFSGEGQALRALGRADPAKLLSEVRAQLTWQNQIDVGDIATRLGAESGHIESALAMLGAQGLAGYDARAAKYFHRELPFDLDAVEALQPRLQGARRLVQAGAVTEFADRIQGQRQFTVTGTDVVHRVRIGESDERCTCPWFSKHQSARGPCRHILATQLFCEDRETESGE